MQQDIITRSNCIRFGLDLFQFKNSVTGGGHQLTNTDENITHCQVARRATRLRWATVDEVRQRIETGTAEAWGRLQVASGMYNPL